MGGVHRTAHQVPRAQPTFNKCHPGLAWFPLFSGSWACSLYF